jgi:hypothetical protein
MGFVNRLLCAWIVARVAASWRTLCTYMHVYAFFCAQMWSTGSTVSIHTRIPYHCESIGTTKSYPILFCQYIDESYNLTVSFSTRPGLDVVLGDLLKAPFEKQIIADYSTTKLFISSV